MLKNDLGIRCLIRDLYSAENALKISKFDNEKTKLNSTPESGRPSAKKR